MSKRKMTDARRAAFDRRNARRRAATVLKLKAQGIAWADKNPGRRGPEWENAFTRDEILRARNS
jgi:hypothetical protein